MTLRVSRRAELIRSTRAAGAPFTVRPAAHRCGRIPEGFLIHTPFKVGKYLISPMTRPLDGGRYAAGVSIRSGAGSMTHDRVMRFVPIFDTHEQATRFAAEQALAWIGPSLPHLAPAADLQQ